MPKPPNVASRARFLHIIPDDKYIDAAHGVFEEAAPEAHDYLIVGNSGPLRYIRTFRPERLGIDAALKADFLQQLPSYKAVFVHYLTNAARWVVSAAPSETRFLWLAWGADYCHLIYRREELFLPETYGLLSESLFARKWQDLLNLLREGARMVPSPIKAVRLARLHSRFHEIAPNSAGEPALINRFEAIATPIIEDYHAIRAKQPEVNISFLDWNYWTEGFYPHNQHIESGGKNILLGNSATPENNHLEALEYLSEILPADRKVICPLSYGAKWYGDAVERSGRKLLGSRFVPLRKFMDSAAYSEVLGSCSIVLMNHVRQQAIGSILLSMSAGARVFLNAVNPINKAMQRIGVPIDTIGALPEFLKREEKGVSAENLFETREKLDAHFGRSSVLRRTREILESLQTR